MVVSRMDDSLAFRWLMMREQTNEHYLGFVLYFNSIIYLFLLLLIFVVENYVVFFSSLLSLLFRLLFLLDDFNSCLQTNEGKRGGEERKQNNYNSI